MGRSSWALLFCAIVSNICVSQETLTGTPSEPIAAAIAQPIASMDWSAVSTIPRRAFRPYVRGLAGVDRPLPTDASLPQEWGRWLGTQHAIDEVTHEQWQALTREGLLRDDLPWAWRQLLESMQDPGRWTRIEDLIDHFIVQLGQDDVPGNASASAELLWVALQECPERALPALCARWGTTKDAQAHFYIAALALTWAVGDAETIHNRQRSWSDAMSGEPTELAGWNSAGGSAHRHLLGMARWLATMPYWSAPDGLWDIASHVRRHAWALLELANPAPIDTWLEILADSERGRDQRHALTIILARAPHLLATVKARAIVIDYLSEWQPYWGCDRSSVLVAFLTQDSDQLFGATQTSTYGEYQDGVWVETGSYTWEQRGHFDDYLYCWNTLRERPIADFNPAWLTQMIEHIGDLLDIAGPPAEQLELAGFLRRLDPDIEIPTLHEIALANLGDDDEPSNASWALYSFLTPYGCEGEQPAIDPALIQAAVESGLAFNDWQLIGHASQLAASRNEPIAAEEVPGLIDFLVEQLADDVTDSNATFALMALGSFGRRIEPWLPGDDAPLDDQQRAMLKRLRETWAQADAPTIAP